MIVNWTLADDRRISADVPAGQTLMEAAQAHDVTGVIGECGGNMACATCHVVVDPRWSALAGTPDTFEDSMLDVADAAREPTSRLSCQIRMRAVLDGIELRVPAG